MVDWKDNSESGRGPVVQTEPSPNQHVEDTDTMAPSKSTRSPAFQFYPKDYLTDTNVIAMSYTERGVYWHLVSICWLEGSLPPETKALARLLGMTPTHFARLWPAIAPCFKARADGRLLHSRLEKERKAQAEYRKRQQDAAASRWHKPKPSHGDALLSSSPISNLQSASAERGRAPLHDMSHRKHALCGRVCLHASQFNDFVRRRNHDGADAEVNTWAFSVIQEWTDGAMKAVEPGDPFDFWRARYDEKWPAPRASTPDRRRPAWAQ